MFRRAVDVSELHIDQRILGPSNSKIFRREVVGYLSGVIGRMGRGEDKCLDVDSNSTNEELK